MGGTSFFFVSRVLTPSKYSSIHLITFVRTHITSILYNAEKKPGPSDEVGGGRKHHDSVSETDSLSAMLAAKFTTLDARGSEQQIHAAEGGALVGNVGYVVSAKSSQKSVGLTCRQRVGDMLGPMSATCGLS